MLKLERQWVREFKEAAPDHRGRYKFAAQIGLPPFLDAACGTGYGTAHLNKTGRAVGIDIEPKAIRHARKWHPECEFHVMDIRQCQALGRFHTVVSLETIEHVKAPDAALKAFREIANRLVASVPNEDNYPYEKGHWSSHDYPHYRHYRPQEFEDLLNSSGWRVVGKHHQAKKSETIAEGAGGRFLVYVAE